MSGHDPRKVERVGPYRVIRLHAEGGQAWIFEVEDPKFSVRRALKALKPQGGPAGEFERFRSEAQVLAAISHPYLLTPYDFGRDEATSWFFYTMDFVEGETLAERLAHGPLSLEELRAIFVPVLDGLVAVHEAGVVHRDIKPSNILVSSQGHAYLADLGIMVDPRSEATSDSGRTETGLALGTARYMSPEQARGRREEMGPQSDVFSLGLVIFEALTGSHAYAGANLSTDSGAEILMYLGSRVYEDKDLDLAMDRSVPKPLQAFVRRACRVRPENRFASAREMRDAFLEALRAAEGAQTGAHRGAAAALRSAARTLGLRDGLLLALAALLVVAFLLARSWRAETRAGMLLTRATELEKRATSLLRSFEQTTGALGVETDVARRGALFELDAARAYLADGMPADAAERAQRAVLRFEDLCARIAWSVQKAGARRAEELREHVAAFDAGFLPEDARASKLAPERFAELSARVDSLQEATAADQACDAASERLERLRGAPAIEEAARELEREVGGPLRGVATRLRGEAQAARQRAVAGAVAHPAAREALAAGEEALALADADRGEERWLDAVTGYEDARRRFEQVAAMGPVLDVKLHFEAAEREARAGGAHGLRDASRVYDHAERLLLEGDLEAAAQEYQRALDVLRAEAPSPQPGGSEG